MAIKKKGSKEGKEPLRGGQQGQWGLEEEKAHEWLRGGPVWILKGGTTKKKDRNVRGRMCRAK